MPLPRPAADAETEYPVRANISEFEWHLIEQFRKLAAHGFGTLHVEVSHHAAVQSQTAFRDDPEELKRLQA